MNTDPALSITGSFEDHLVNELSKPLDRAMFLEIAVEDFLTDGDRAALELSYRYVVAGRKHAEQETEQP